jgi:hypothetical protein
MSQLLPNQQSHHDIQDLPSVVYIRAKTFLCRWDAGCGDTSSGCLRKSSTDKDTWDDSSSLLSDNDGFAEPTATPPRVPMRSFSPPPPRAKRHLETSMQSGVDLGSTSLVPVKFSATGDESISVPLMECAAVSLSTVLQTHQASFNENLVTVVYCIRRAGCGSCRYHGLQLTRLSKKFQNLNLFGLIKETGVDDKALLDFYADYFTFPIYKDHEQDSFRFLGNRKISVWRLLKAQPRLYQRYHKKGIKNVPFGGDIFTQGGVLLFKKGQLRYVYYERFGDELDMEALSWAIRSCQGADTETTLCQLMESQMGPEHPPRLPLRSKSDRVDKAARRPKRHDSQLPATAFESDRA